MSVDLFGSQIQGDLLFDSSVRPSVAPPRTSARSHFKGPDPRIVNSLRSQSGEDFAGRTGRFAARGFSHPR